MITGDALLVVALALGAGVGSALLGLVGVVVFTAGFSLGFGSLLGVYAGEFPGTAARDGIERDAHRGFGRQHDRRRGVHVLSMLSSLGGARRAEFGTSCDNP